MQWEDINRLCDIVRETSFEIHNYHRNSHLEKVYENALAHGLRKSGLQVEQQYPLELYDEDGTMLGGNFADLFVEGKRIIKSSRIETGLLINFGAAKLHRKKYLMTNHSH